MRRVLAIAGLLLAVGVFLAAGAMGADDSDSDGPYLVRAVFDNGSFIVADEDVRIAGANVGHVEDVDVSLPGEVVSHESGHEVQPGKAIVVLNITDPGFQDFLSDASCILRPQSLIGERYVNCRPTMARGPDSPAPAPLEQIPDGAPGAGQYLLPLENNARNVDLDLLTNIQREPYADRFRIILNELGIGFAARGADIAHIVERADPTLRDVNRVLAILAHQRHQLTQLAVDSEQILEPLSAQRTHVSGFLRNAGTSAEATAEKKAELEEALAKFPAFLGEFRQTMASFDDFSTAALPVTRQLGVAAPSLTRATEALAPFAGASDTALTSFGKAAEESGPTLAAADPIVKKSLELARTGVDPTKYLQQFLRSLKQTGGFERLMDLIYFTTGSVNGFDQVGHYLRTALVPTNCVDYVPGYQTGCDARFKNGGLGTGHKVEHYPGLTPVARQSTHRRRTKSATENETRSDSPGTDAAAPPAQAEPTDPETSDQASGDSGVEVTPDGSGPADPEVGSGSGQGAPTTEVAPAQKRRALRDLLDFLVGQR